MGEEAGGIWSKSFYVFNFFLFSLLWFAMFTKYGLGLIPNERCLVSHFDLGLSAVIYSFYE